MRDKQRVFIEEYFKDWNATQAALRAGYKNPNKQGPRLLVNVGIQEAIRQRISEKAMSADEVLTRLAEHARGSMGDFLDITSVGFEIDLWEAKEKGLLHLIKKVRMKTTIINDANDRDIETHDMEIELYDAQAALVHLGRYHKLFTDNADITSGGKPLKSYVSISPDDWDKQPTINSDL